MINNSSASNTYIHTACKQKMPTGHGVSMIFIQGAIDFFVIENSPSESLVYNLLLLQKQ